VNLNQTHFFAPASDLKEALQARVDRFFRASRKSRHANAGMYVKAGILLAWFGLSYYALVFAAANIWQGLLAAVSLGLAVAGIGFNIQHDGNHGSFSKHGWLNRLAGLTLDLMGASSYLWVQKHNLAHHTYTNIPGSDEDIEIFPFGRLAPDDPYYSLHRFQHFYLWLAYAFLPTQWFFYNDFRKLWTGKISHRTFPRPRSWELFGLIAGKLLFAAWALVIPCFFHRLWVVALYYLLVSGILGVVLSVVFQLAHSVEETGHPSSADEIRSEWVRHQIQTTAEFARGNRLVTWYLGGLNFQTTHHLFPKVCHVHYPRLSRIIERTCRKHGVEYLAQPTVRSAVRSHYRFLRSLSTRPAANAVPPASRPPQGVSLGA
jgi:linoleoyl-CoA desaturase